jgi:hypothetical protein
LRKPGTQTIGKPSILLVAHPDEKMPAALKEMKVVQAIDTEVTTLFLAKGYTYCHAVTPSRSSIRAYWVS